VINHGELASQITTSFIAKIFKLFLPVLSDEQKGNEAVDKLIKGYYLNKTMIFVFIKKLIALVLA